MASTGLGACVGTSGLGAHANDGPPRVTFDSEAAKEKLGNDDGFQAAIFYGAELMGSIDDCGCPGHPQGGLPWRLGYTEGFRSAYPDSGYLQVDAGHSMSNSLDMNGKLHPDQYTKDDWVIDAFGKFNFDAANISHNDIYYLAQYLKSDGTWDKSVAKYPMLARYVSANIEPDNPASGLIAPPPYVVRTMTGKRLAGGSLRVAIIGLTENNPSLPMQTGFRVVPSEVALEKILPKAKSESDMVVVLFYGAPDAAQALAKRFTGKVDVFIVAHPRARESEPSLGGPVNIAYCKYQTRQLGELRMQFDGTTLTSVTNRFVTLDEQLPKDPVAADMAAQAKEAIRKAQEERFNASNPQTPQPPPASGGN
jgi:hypothetical protein